MTYGFGGPRFLSDFVEKSAVWGPACPVLVQRQRCPGGNSLGGNSVITLS